MVKLVASLLVVLAVLSPVVQSGRPALSARASRSAADQEIDGTFDVGGRSLYLRCSGLGSPTVLLESGSDVTSDAWEAIQRSLGPMTRTCAYDRANLGRSDAAPTPRSGRDVVEDLHRLLGVAELQGPYVLVGASLGGLFVRLYAQAYPEEVVGMVLLDAMHEDLVARFTALLDPALAEPLTAALAGRNSDEGFVVDGLVSTALTDEVRSAREATPLPEMPLIVITPGTFQVLGVASLPGWPTDDADRLWSALQADLATLTPDGRLVLAEGSGHFVQGDRPDLALEAVAEVVEAVRGRTASATPATSGERRTGGPSRADRVGGKPATEGRRYALRQVGAGFE